MAEKVVTKKSFIGGRIVLPGEVVDVDAKGELAPAASTPIGALTVDQLRSALNARESSEKGEQFGGNLADRSDASTGSQPLEMARVAPASAGSTAPQGLPPGTEPHGESFFRPASEGAEAAVEEVVGAEAAAPAAKPRRRAKAGDKG
ncbi:MAG TPA: hypothetical protein VF655_00155 [Allosphingosinicella sp.]|jgi:hypothetical protein